MDKKLKRALTNLKISGSSKPVEGAGNAAGTFTFISKVGSDSDSGADADTEDRPKYWTLDFVINAS